ncbi:MAG: TIGR03435 family protein [Acetobacteraceae bacterium]
MEERMKELYDEGRPSHADPESCVASRKAGREALTGAHVAGVSSREMPGNQDADAVYSAGRQHWRARHRGLGDRIESLLRRGRRFSARPSLAGLGVSALLLAALLGVGGLVPGWIAIAQTKATPPTSFEVASIRPANPSQRLRGFYPRPGRFWAINLPVKVLIDEAYHLDPVQLEGLPSWAGSRPYTIQAVMPPDMPRLPPRQISQLQDQMLRSLLGDRFKLKVHYATKILPVYNLVVAKGGLKMKSEPAAEYIKGQHSRTTLLAGRYWTMGSSSSRIAEFLTSIVGRTVIDKTGLTGRYDFNLTWTPWRIEAKGMAGSPGFGGNGGNEAGMAPAPDSSNLSIFTAIQQQLGLRLKPAKGPVKVLVVDHVEPPTPN